MKLTREQIEAMRDYLMDLECPFTEAEGNALCDLALTALSAEPVACDSCGGTGRTDNHVTGEIECATCEGEGTQFTAPPDLLAENKRLREALEFIAEHYTDTSLAAKHMSAHARMVLSGTGNSADYVPKRAALREPK